MRGIMTARTKPLEVIDPSEKISLTESVSFDKPRPKGECKIISRDNINVEVKEHHNVAEVI